MEYRDIILLGFLLAACLPCLAMLYVGVYMLIREIHR